MTKSNRKKKDIEIRRNEILDAVERIYEMGNFESVTMDDIAKEAEFTKQTLYAYFKGKDEIMASIYVRAANRINGMIKSKLDEQESMTGYEKLDLMRIVFTEIAVKKPLYTKMISIYQLKDLNEFKELGIYEEIITKNANLTSYMSDCIAKGIVDGSVAKNTDVQSGVLFLKALILGAVSMVIYNEQYMRQELKLTPLESLSTIFEFSMKAFKNNPVL
ncbi:MAG: TetR/AcrR family transcriptional regulator [Dethiosulfatibacter sp.]|nr:TetR/AcrR family transcriptional regulator [Dethiosulfatibacter sp.]